MGVEALADHPVHDEGWNPEPHVDAHHDLHFDFLLVLLGDEEALLVHAHCVLLGVARIFDGVHGQTHLVLALLHPLHEAVFPRGHHGHVHDEVPFERVALHIPDVRLRPEVLLGLFVALVLDAHLQVALVAQGLAPLHVSQHHVHAVASWLGAVLLACLLALLELDGPVLLEEGPHDVFVPLGGNLGGFFVRAAFLELDDQVLEVGEVLKGTEGVEDGAVLDFSFLHLLDEGLREFFFIEVGVLLLDASHDLDLELGAVFFVDVGLLQFVLVHVFEFGRDGLYLFVLFSAQFF